MAYITGNTKQHIQGSVIEDFIFKEMKENGYDVYIKIPEKMKMNIEKNIIKLLNTHTFDFFMIENEKFFVVEVKSKRINFSKDDRKIDISNNQERVFEKLRKRGINCKMVVVWFFEEGYNYNIFEYEKLSMIGIKKRKIKLPKEINYSPERVKYNKFPKKIIRNMKEFTS